MKFTIPFAPIRNCLPTASDRAALNLVTTASTLCFLIMRRPIRSSQSYIKLSSPMKNSIQGNMKG
jgi:hypothetical protein